MGAGATVCGICMVLWYTTHLGSTEGSSSTITKIFIIILCFYDFKGIRIIYGMEEGWQGTTRRYNTEQGKLPITGMSFLKTVSSCNLVVVVLYSRNSSRNLYLSINLFNAILALVSQEVRLSPLCSSLVS